MLHLYLGCSDAEMATPLTNTSFTSVLKLITNVKHRVTTPRTVSRKIIYLILYALLDGKILL